jgi:hypothetical protein
LIPPDELDSLEITAHILSDVNHSLEEIKSKLQNTLEKQKQDEETINALQSTQEMLNHTIQNSKHEITTLRTLLSEKEQSIATLSTTNSTLESDFKQLKKSHRKLKRLVRTFRDENRALKRDLVDSKKESEKDKQRIGKVVFMCMKVKGDLLRIHESMNVDSNVSTLNSPTLSTKSPTGMSPKIPPPTHSPSRSPTFTNIVPSEEPRSPTSNTSPKIPLPAHSSPKIPPPVHSSPKSPILSPSSVSPTVTLPSPKLPLSTPTPITPITTTIHTHTTSPQSPITLQEKYNALLLTKIQLESKLSLLTSQNDTQSTLNKPLLVDDIRVEELKKEILEDGYEELSTPEMSDFEDDQVDQGTVNVHVNTNTNTNINADIDSGASELSNKDKIEILESTISQVRHSISESWNALVEIDAKVEEFQRVYYQDVEFGGVVTTDNDDNGDNENNDKIGDENENDGNTINNSNNDKNTDIDKEEDTQGHMKSEKYSIIAEYVVIQAEIEVSNALVHEVSAGTLSETLFIRRYWIMQVYTR